MDGWMDGFSLRQKLLTCLQSGFYSFPWYFSKTVSDTIKYNSVCQYMTGWNCLAAIPQSVTGMLSICFSMITTASTVWKLQFWTQSIFQTIQTRKQDMKAKACCWMRLHLVAVYMLHHAITVTAWWDSSALIVTQWSQSTPQPINNIQIERQHHPLTACTEPWNTAFKSPYWYA